MAKRPLPDQALLLKLLRYEPDTGKLYWRERTPDMFDSDKLSSSTRCSQWNSRFANKEAFTADNGKGYRVGCITGFGTLRAHRVIWLMVYGVWPNQIDHENQDRSDNRLRNLINSDRELNARNACLSRRNRSGRIGVFWSRSAKRWRTTIRHGGKYINLGYFKSFDEACRTRLMAEKKYNYSPRHGSKRHDT